MRIVIFFFIFFLFGFSRLNAQVIELKCVDQRTGDLIPNTSITLNLIQGNDFDSSLNNSTNFNGKAFFRVNNFKIGQTLSFEFRHPIYESLSKNIKPKTTFDTLKLEIPLYRIKIKELKQVVVKAPGVPDTVFHSERLSVADFEIQNNDDIILLTYPKQLQKGSEILLFDGVNIKSNFQVDDQAQYLVSDYRGNTHIVCKEKVFGIKVSKNEIQLGSIPKDYFFKYLAPIVDTNASKMYFSNFNKDYPAFDYFVFDTYDSTYRSILNIKDDLMMELYRSEYKWMDVRTKLWAKNKERETGIDAQIWVGANYFTQSIYYKEVYAPLFHRNDSVFVFDYPKDRLVIFNRVGESLDTIPIYHHYQPKKTGWQKQLIQDNVTGVIYAQYENDGNMFLGIVDVKTGEISEKVKLHYKYVEKIRVHNNKVFYIYRPFESIQKRFLYKEKLPYNFSPAALIVDRDQNKDESND
jgi:hypothetical protein